MEIIFKRLTECKIDDIITAWNCGFEGYFVQIEMTPETFFQRIVNEGLSLKLSLVGFSGSKPLAIIMNGVRTLAGKKTVWNGGTAVAPEYRGKGVSRLLMEETLKLYKEEGIEAATLEAIKENERAIRLYQRYGYEIEDHIVFLTGSWAGKAAIATSLRAASLRPEQLAKESFYKENVPWQCQWQSVRAGEAKVFYGNDREALGYCLFRRVWNDKGTLEKIIIYQLELFTEVTSGLVELIFESLAGRTNTPVSIMTVNTSTANPAIPFLLEKGFEAGTEQVQMMKK